eukprot:CAMPEP_0197037552 /NCGR_PEP_ID=MMETSP1384-20130603/14730_1 /TAXON_ID=29189 /ORGANISM="Ammonia sp." /LENGTH=327 /DNA_ID=CAMNT_0042467867 /DNA_START=50 /DNA_END=1033 /DNA_ORIENTATION=+
MADAEVNEMGLLDAFNYEVEDPKGMIDPSDNIMPPAANNNSKKKSNKKSKSTTSTKAKGDEFTEISINNDHFNDGKANNLSSSSPTKLTQCQAWMSGIFYWIPIRHLCFIGNVALFVFPILDARFSTLNFIEYMLSWYIWIFALIGMLIESPTWVLTKWLQLKIFFFARFLRRASGRAFFYTTVSIMTFAGVQEHVTWSMFAGLYMMMASCLLMVFSLLAAKKLHLMYSYMVYSDAAVQINGNEMEQKHASNEENKISATYFSLDHNRSKRIGAEELYSFSEQSLNRKLSNSERYTLQCYLDVTCNGFITPQDWTRQFLNSQKVKFL